MTVAHSTKTLVAQLRALGVADGDTLMVHASLRRIGRHVDELLVTNES